MFFLSSKWYDYFAQNFFFSHQGPEVSYDGDSIRDTVAWIQGGGLQEYLEGVGFPPDNSLSAPELYFLAHSAGSHELVEVLKTDCTEDIRGLVLVRETAKNLSVLSEKMSCEVQFCC